MMSESERYDARKRTLTRKIETSNIGTREKRKHQNASPPLYVLGLPRRPHLPMPSKNSRSARNPFLVGLHQGNHLIIGSIAVRCRWLRQARPEMGRDVGDLASVSHAGRQLGLKIPIRPLAEYIF